jgi:predicted  nucleic acid-binding Zn-ribbon protein
VEDLLDRVVKAEERTNKQDAITTRSNRAKLALGPAENTEQSK